jgi:microcystin-dependent protein
MPYLGEIRMFAGTFAPSGWAKCDGSLLAIQDYPELYSLLGKTYGGDGQSTFGLPDLGPNTPIHRSSAHPLGETASGPLGVDAQPAPVLFIIATTTPPASADIPFVGEIRTFSFGAVPREWALCDGSILNIKDYAALYSIIENRYGGSNEQLTFALPDLRANTVKPVSAADPLGYVVMSDCIALEGTFPSSS